MAIMAALVLMVIIFWGVPGVVIPVICVILEILLSPVILFALTGVVILLIIKLWNCFRGPRG